MRSQKIYIDPIYSKGQIKNRERELYFDFLKGVSIIAVVAIHTTNAVFDGGQTQISGFNYYYTLFLSKLCVFSVPTFFFIAGYFGQKKIATVVEYREFLKKRLSRILVPYMFWSVIVVFFIHQNFSPYNLFYRILLGKALGPYYFIIAMVQLVILAPFLHLLANRRAGIVIVLSVGIFSVLSVYVIEIFSNYVLGWWVPLLFCGTWIIFYFCGILVKEKNKNWLFNKFNTPKSALFLVVVALIFFILEKICLHTFLSGSFGDVKFSWLLYSLSVINYFMVIKGRIKKISRVIVSLGQLSFGIYLTHEVFRGGVSDMMKSINSLYLFQPIFQSIVVLLTLSICIIVIASARKIFGRKVSEAYFGL